MRPSAVGRSTRPRNSEREFRAGAEEPRGEKRKGALEELGTLAAAVEVSS